MGPTTMEDHNTGNGANIVEYIVVGFVEVIVEMDVDSGDSKVFMWVDHPSKGVDACQS